MDTSNPVLPSDRHNIVDVLNMCRRRRRQNLSYLEDVARTSPRVNLSVSSQLLDDHTTKDVYERFVATIPDISGAKDEPLPDVMSVAFDSVPICGLVGYSDIPLHPPTVNNKRGRVCVQRTMGGRPGAPMGLRSIIQIVGGDVLKRKHVYTAGTWSGFCKRLVQQMGRKTVPLSEAYTREYGIKYTNSNLIVEISKHMPRAASKGWPSLDGDLNEMISKLDINSSSSAGAPYWRNKGECLDDIITSGLSAVVIAIKEQKLNLLWRENPELFLCEVKNKQDRYEIARLDDKTRPYCSIPAHWAFLFSVLTQRFQETLFLCVDDYASCNAYGFSSAHGGLGRMYDWMVSCPVGQSRVACYGDDTLLVYNDGKHIYRVDPDFVQMDGSLNREDMKLVIGWVLNTLMAEDGIDSAFWKTVARVWLDMASDPRFFLEGEAVFRKKQPHGFMSGVPGTTLFTTVKSVLMWKLYLYKCKMVGKSPMDVAFATDFMARNGLVIKEGTFKPAIVPLQLEHGLLITDHKFLGIQMKAWAVEDHFVMVPCIPEADVLEMLVVQKDNPNENKHSLVLKRRLFDRMRGIFVTCAFNYPRMIDVIHNVVNAIDPVAILLDVQNGTGDRPDHITLEDFDYPTSSGFPTIEFCLSMYSSNNEKVGWQEIYPTLGKFLKELGKENRLVDIKRKTRDNVTTVEYVPSSEFTSLPYVDEMGVVADLPVVKPITVEYTSPNPRSKIDVGKFNANLTKSIFLYLRDGPRTVAEVRTRFLISAAQLFTVVKASGLFCTGMEGIDTISTEPIQTPLITIQNQTSDVSTTYNLVDQTTAERKQSKVKAGAEVPSSFIKTSSSHIFIEDSFFEAISPLSAPESDDLVSELVTQLKAKIGIQSVRFVTEMMPSGAAQPVGLTMQAQGVGVNANWYVVARTSSLSSKLAKQYISRAFFEKAGFSIPTDKFVAKGKVEFNPDPRGNWFENVQQQELVDHQNRMAMPPVVGSHTDYVLDELYNTYGNQPIFEQLVAYVRFYRERGYCDSNILSIIVQKVIPHIEDSEPVSRRSKLTAAKRSKLNRKTNQRRKRKLVSLV